MREEKVMQIKNLSKKYGDTMALRNVNLELTAGRIYGLIGQNGAGKTTLFRMTAGLGFPSEGEIRLFGKTGEKELQQQRRRMGCMIETPSLNPGLSAWENLHLQKMMRGISNQHIENEMLKTVGLSDVGRKKAKHFSLGMKQRLGIGVAMLGNPELLLLDEPINGLDPMGVVEIRNLLKGLCEEKHVTILISSHNLPELYQVATDYVILHGGEVKQQLSHEELDVKCRQHLLIRAGNSDQLASILESELHTRNYTVMPDQSIKLYDFLDEQERVAKVLYENGVIISNFSMQGESLENYYLSMISSNIN